MERKDLIKTVSLSISGLMIVGFIILALIVHGQRNNTPLIPVSADNFGGSYTLTNHLGDTVTDADLSGQYQLLYFGFTFCPAICPTELSKMTDVLDALGTKGENIQPVFITVDPERDTAEVMKNYIDLFHPRFIGYTGTVEQIEHVKKLYKVYSAKFDDPNMTEYTVDHSSYIYFIDPNGQLLSLYKIDDKAEYVAKDIARWLAQQSS